MMPDAEMVEIRKRMLDSLGAAMSFLQESSYRHEVHELAPMIRVALDAIDTGTTEDEISEPIVKVLEYVNRALGHRLQSILARKACATVADRVSAEPFVPITTVMRDEEAERADVVIDACPSLPPLPTTLVESLAIAPIAPPRRVA